MAPAILVISERQEGRLAFIETPAPSTRTSGNLPLATASNRSRR
jgi:hypothetical protein